MNCSRSALASASSLDTQLSPDFRPGSSHAAGMDTGGGLGVVATAGIPGVGERQVRGVPGHDSDSSDSPLYSSGVRAGRRLPTRDETEFERLRILLAKNSGVREALREEVELERLRSLPENDRLSSGVVMREVLVASLRGGEPRASTSQVLCEERGSEMTTDRFMSRERWLAEEWV